MQIHAVKWMDEVLGIALERMPEPRILDALDVAETATETSPESTSKQPATGINPH